MDDAYAFATLARVDTRLARVVTRETDQLDAATIRDCTALLGDSMLADERAGVRCIDLIQARECSMLTRVASFPMPMAFAICSSQSINSSVSHDEKGCCVAER